MITFVPISTETELRWLKRVGQVPLLGGLVALFFSAWPATLYINAAELALGVRDPPLHVAVGFALAGAWSALLWFRLRTRIKILLIPAFAFWPVVGLLMLVR